MMMTFSRLKPRRVVAEVVNWSLEVSEFKLQSHYNVQFWTNALGEGMNPFITQQWVEYYHCTFSTIMALA